MFGKLFKFSSDKNQKASIGAYETVDFLDFDIKSAPSKIDTGADVSSIHCTDIEVEHLKGGKKRLYFTLPRVTSHHIHGKTYKTTNFSRRVIKNSFGDKERRYVITTNIGMAGKIIEARFTLADRTNMKYPILIGKELLRHHFVVDVSKHQYPHRRKRKEISDA